MKSLFRWHIKVIAYPDNPADCGNAIRFKCGCLCLIDAKGDIELGSSYCEKHYQRRLTHE